VRISLNTWNYATTSDSMTLNSTTSFQNCGFVHCHFVNLHRGVPGGLTPGQGIENVAPESLVRLGLRINGLRNDVVSKKTHSSLPNHTHSNQRSSLYFSRHYNLMETAMLDFLVTM